MKLSRLMYVLLPLCLLFTFSGCGTEKAELRLSEFSSGLSEKTELSFTADMRCEYPDKAEKFALLFEKKPDGCTVTVISPESIAGIKAHVGSDTNKLEYGGAVLDVGDLDQYGLSPMSALPLLYRALCSPYIDSVTSAGDGTEYLLTYDDNTCVSVRFSAEMIPESAELICDGKVTVYCKIEDWS